jgi:hypothetical protein
MENVVAATRMYLFFKLTFLKKDTETHETTIWFVYMPPNNF